MAGVLLIPVIIYKFLKTGQPAPLWGGWFEVGMLYSFFSLSALAMFLYTKGVHYLLLFLLFVGFVFLSMRRSAMLGLSITLIFLLYLLRGFVSKKVLAFVLLSLTFAGSLTFGILVERDHRFAIAWELITGKRALDDQALNVHLKPKVGDPQKGFRSVAKRHKRKELLGAFDRARHKLRLLSGAQISRGWHLRICVFTFRAHRKGRSWSCGYSVALVCLLLFFLPLQNKAKGRPSALTFLIFLVLFVNW
jgi:hypothetical protein